MKIIVQDLRKYGAKNIYNIWFRYGKNICGYKRVLLIRFLHFDFCILLSNWFAKPKERGKKIF